ncbi:polygalacturonase-like [Rutidosis leptorrhynchoides]|uniref:polygalacturonase-like n=1 Tax=Rutidosis leptorrhynchoides TaxID=125765 RepID=UPI003A9945AE
MVIKHIILLLFIIFQHSLSKVTYNLVNLGAKNNGLVDTKDAFLKAWNLSCAFTSPAIINVPTGKYLIASAVLFSGQTCKSKAITFNISGTLVAPSSYNAIGNDEVWIKFQRVNHLTITGGTLDAQGAPLWACKSSGKTCPNGATTLGIYHSQNVVINKLRSLNSQMFHILLYACTNAKVQGVSILASASSPNTDGIHLQSSTNITILSSKISTGDDCVSIGPGNSNIWIEKVVCGPGHGISIGSLGWELEEAGVQNVTVKTATFVGTQNGVRIKTWARRSNGFVKDVVFEQVTMVNVKTPILIDQNYCPSNENCPEGQVSEVKISNVLYDDIHGTSATQVAVKLDCSTKSPCSGISLQNIKLVYNGQPANSSCSNAVATAYGSPQPTSCM